MRVAVVELCSPVRADLRLASSLHTAFAASPHPPPSASHTNGIKAKPSSWQVVSVAKWERLKSSYVSTAIEPFSADLRTISLLRPLVTARSRAAGKPLRQRGRYTSAGRRVHVMHLTLYPLNFLVQHLIMVEVAGDLDAPVPD